MDTYSQLFLTTKRLKTAYYRSGEKHDKKLLLLHGNLSSSAFFLPLLPALSQWFDVVIPDLRCFGDSEARSIDATRGYRDWSDDIAAFTDALGWEHFSIVGWSMGGNIAMQYAIDHSRRLDRLVLLAPGSPFGFGGTKDSKGTPLIPQGLGSGGGSINPHMLMAITAQGDLVLRHALNNFYFTPAFRLDRKLESLLINGITKTKLGDDKYPGDYHYTFQWPFVVAGKHGVLNTMSPTYGNLSKLVEIEKKPPILWIRGRDDLIISDNSMFEFGYLGSIGLIPGWPGHRHYPPQPMIAQTRYILDRYQEKGGLYHELVIPGGHACHLESSEYFIPTICSFLQG